MTLTLDTPSSPNGVETRPAREPATQARTSGFARSTPPQDDAVRPITRTLIALALTLFALGAAITSATSAFWGAFAGFILMGLGKPAFDVGAMTYLADRTPYERRARYLATLELTWAELLTP